MLIPVCMVYSFKILIPHEGSCHFYKRWQDSNEIFHYHFEGKDYLKPQMQHNVLRLNERVKSLERESEVSTKLETLSSTWVNC